MFVLNFLFLAMYNGRAKNLHTAAVHEGLNICYMFINTPITEMPSALRTIKRRDPRVTITISSMPDWQLQIYKLDTVWHVYNKFFNPRERWVKFSYKLGNSSWLNIAIDSHYDINRLFIMLLVTELAIIFIMLLYFWSLYRFKRSLHKIKHATSELGIDIQAQTNLIDETTDIIDKLRFRVAKLLQERTLTLAALSHDLRTIITRLQLRSQFIKEENIQAQIVALLDEIEEMINVTLIYAEQSYSAKQNHKIDIVSLVAAICDDLQESGYKVEFKSKLKRHELLADTKALRYAITAIIKIILQRTQKLTISLEIDKNIKVMFKAKPALDLKQELQTNYTFELASNILNTVVRGRS